MEGRRGWLAGPMALLGWIRARRERREREAALEQFGALVEAFVMLLEDFRAGRLPMQDEGSEPKRAEANGAGAMAYPSPPLWSASRPEPTRGEGVCVAGPVRSPSEDDAPLRFPACSAVETVDDEGRGEPQKRKERAPRAIDPSEPQGGQSGVHFHWSPGFAGMTKKLSISKGYHRRGRFATATPRCALPLESGFRRNDEKIKGLSPSRALGAHARAPPATGFRKSGLCGWDYCDHFIAVSKCRASLGAMPVNRPGARVPSVRGATGLRSRAWRSGGLRGALIRSAHPSLRRTRRRRFPAAPAPGRSC